MSQLLFGQADQVADEAPQPIEIVRDILREAESLPRLMEVSYLAQEPGLIEIMRGLIALADEERFRLQQYLARRRGRRFYVRELPTGALVLETAEESAREENP
jgi:hypothetical protein